MKIIKVLPNNRKKAFEVDTRGSSYVFPYAVVRPMPTQENGVVSVRVDDEMDREGFVYTLVSGDELIRDQSFGTRRNPLTVRQNGSIFQAFHPTGSASSDASAGT